MAVLPADTDLSKFTDTMIGFYAENKIQWGEKFRSVLAVRGDEAVYDVNNLTPNYVAAELPGAPVVNFAAANSGTATKFLPQPKASFFFGPWSKTELYVQGGFSFHSNDARGATQSEEPISPDNHFLRPHRESPHWLQLREWRLAFALPPSPTSRARYHSGISTVRPNCSSTATVLFNGEVRYRITRQWSVVAEALNLLNRKDHDIDYAYTARITPIADAAFTEVFHPVEPFQLRIGLRCIFGSHGKMGSTI